VFRPWFIPLFAVLSTMAAAQDGPRRHRFLAVDESRKLLHYVDEAVRSNDWSVAGPFRDIQLIGDHRVALSDGAGVSIVDLKARRVVAGVHPPRARGTQSFRWLADGRLLIVAGNGVLTTDALGGDFGHAPRPLGARICRTTGDGGWVSGVGAELVDVAPDGTVRTRFTVPDIKHFYHVAKRADGGYYGACGYSGCAVSLDAKGAVLQRFDHPTRYFFAGLQVLTNGNLVVANWSGHGRDDARNAQKGPQIVEFAPDGKVVWTFYDPDKLGSIHHAVILDELDTALPYDEVGGRFVPMAAVSAGVAPLSVADANSLDGVAFLPDGALALSVPNLNDRKRAPALLRLAPDGSARPLAAIAPAVGSERFVPFGLDAAPDGTVYVADNQFFSESTPKPLSRLLAIAPDGTTRVVASGLRVANGVRVHGDGVYVSDTQIAVTDGKVTSALFRFPARGEPVTIAGDPLATPLLVARFDTPIRRDPFGADGIVVDGRGRVLVSFFDAGTVVRLTLDAAGKITAQEEAVPAGILPSADGMALDAKSGAVIIADPRGQAVHALSPDGALRTIVRGGLLDMPVDVTARDGRAAISSWTSPGKPCRLLGLDVPSLPKPEPAPQVRETPRPVKRETVTLPEL
jgi:sugar lactone lactonase YvrE